MHSSAVRFASEQQDPPERRTHKHPLGEAGPPAHDALLSTGHTAAELMEGYEADVDDEADELAGPDEGLEEPEAIARLQAKVTQLHWLPAWVRYILSRALTASCRLETETSISLSLRRLRAYRAARQDMWKITAMCLVSGYSLYVMERPGFPIKLGLPILYTVLLLVPLTSQFFLPAAPIFAWLSLFYSAQFIPPRERPHIWVSLLPTLEHVWYGANISEMITRLGHPMLDIFAWIPYGIVHFSAPFFVAAFLFILGPPASVKFFAAAFGFLNMIGVVVQTVLPCVPPWYQVRDGLTPATHDMKGSPAGLARIDKLFGGHGYTRAFTNAPVPFGAFPSLHAGCATMEALMLSYFFPLGITLFRSTKPSPHGWVLRLDMRIVYWCYTGWLYWCTMYLMHHFFIDLVAGACLATACFYIFLSDEMREAMEIHWFAHRSSSPAPLSAVPGPHRPTSAFGVRRMGNPPLRWADMRAQRLPAEQALYSTDPGGTVLIADPEADMVNKSNHDTAQHTKFLAKSQNLRHVLPFEDSEQIEDASGKPNTSPPQEELELYQIPMATSKQEHHHPCKLDPLPTSPPHQGKPSSPHDAHYEEHGEKRESMEHP